MRLLAINDETRAAVAEVVAHAMHEQHYYEPGISNQPPGDDPRHIVLLNTYRCVFSITRAPDGKPWRHLSISVPRKGKYPNELAVLTIANLFGFIPQWEGHSRIPEGWTIGPNKDEECVVVAQPLS
jgi:hypothetical protein